MIINPDSIILCTDLQVEVDGVPDINIVEVNTETGAAKRLKTDENGRIVYTGNKYTIEDVILPLDKLHIYLVKPK